MSIREPAGRDEELARELQALAGEVSALRSEIRRLGAALPRDDAAGWQDDAARPASHAWIPALAPPRRGPVRIPRLPLEIAFLAGVAALAGFADLRPVEIAVAMAAAWIVVACAEWAGSRGDRLRASLQLAPPFAIAPPPAATPADPAWFSPPVEQTLLGSASDQSTAVTTLPPARDPEATAEHRAGA